MKLKLVHTLTNIRSRLAPKGPVIAVAALLFASVISQAGVASAYIECSSTTWGLVANSGQVVEGPPQDRVYLQVWLYALRDSHDGAYCGGVYAAAQDSWHGGCVHQDLVVQYQGGNWVGNSHIDPYHCTQNVIIQTPVVYPTEGSTIFGFNWFDELGANLASPTWYVP